MKALTSIFITVFFICTTQAALADIIADRQANFSASGKAMRIIGRALANGDEHDTVQDEALKLAKWADMIPKHFPEGSVSRDARPAIWADFERFTMLSKDNAQAARHLAAAADTKDTALMRERFEAMAATCESCHKRFKN